MDAAGGVDADEIHHFYTSYRIAFLVANSISLLLFFILIVGDLKEFTYVGRRLASTIKSSARISRSSTFSGTGPPTGASDNTSRSSHVGSRSAREDRQERAPMCSRLMEYLLWPRLKRLLCFAYVLLQTAFNVDSHIVFGVYTLFERTMLLWASVTVLAAIFSGQIYWAVKISFVMTLSNSAEGKKRSRALMAAHVLWVLGVSGVYCYYLVARSSVGSFLAPIGLALFVMVIAVFGVVTWWRLRAHLAEATSMDRKDKIRRLLRNWAWFSVATVVVSALLIVALGFHINRGIATFNSEEAGEEADDRSIDHTVIDKNIDDIAFDTLLSFIPFVLLWFTWREASREKAKHQQSRAEEVDSRHIRMGTRTSISGAAARSGTSRGARVRKSSGGFMRVASFGGTGAGAAGGPNMMSTFSLTKGATDSAAFGFVNPALTTDPNEAAADSADGEKRDATETSPSHVKGEHVDYEDGTDDEGGFAFDETERAVNNISPFDDTERGVNNTSPFDEDEAASVSRKTSASGHAKVVIRVTNVDDESRSHYSDGSSERSDTLEAGA